MEIEGSWSDLKTRGFLVLRNFISPELVSLAAEDVRAKAAVRSGMYAAMSLAARNVEVAFQTRLEVALAEIRKNTDIDLTDFQALSWYFSRATELWHTDPPAYWAFQNFYQYVNFWIPIVKPRADRTGLSLVPMDVLADKDPTMYEALYGRGAALFVPASVAAKGEAAITHHLDIRVEKTEAEVAAAAAEPRALVVEVDGHMKHVKMSVDIEQIAVTPAVLPGDVVIARGDVLHKGQDHETQRVALSIRALNGNMPVRKEVFLGLSEHARLRMAAPNHPLTTKVLGAYSFYGKDTISARELLKFMGLVGMKQEAAMKVVDAITPRVPELLGLHDYEPGKELFGTLEK